MVKKRPKSKKRGGSRRKTSTSKKKRLSLSKRQIKKKKASKPGFKTDLLLLFLFILGLLILLTPFIYSQEPIIFLLIGIFLVLLSITGRSFYLKKIDHTRKLAFKKETKKHKNIIFLEIVLVLILAIVLIFIYYVNKIYLSSYFQGLDLSLTSLVKANNVFVPIIAQNFIWFIAATIAIIAVILTIATKSKKKSIERKEKKKIKVSKGIVRKEKKVVYEIKRALSSNKDSYKTALDTLYEVVTNNKKVKISLVVAGFGISKEKAEKWGKILENHELVKLKYGPFGEIEIWKK